MSGRRNRLDSIGKDYENCVQLLLGKICSLVPVPREQDFGIDFYCQPRIPVGGRTETVLDLCSVQVKGGSAKLAYGGVNDRGEWQEFEFAWLRSQATPLFLAQVSSDCGSVALYSLWPIWLIFTSGSKPPFRIDFSLASAGTGPEAWRDPVCRRSEEGAGHGDERVWTVDLGPPFLQLTLGQVNDPSFRERAITTLRHRVAIERLMLMRFLQFIPVLPGVTKWTTNEPGFIETRIFQFWDSTPGANIDRLCETAVPLLTNMAIHFEHQNDPTAYHLLPILKWFKDRGLLDPMSEGVYTGLRILSEQGLPPAYDIDRAD